MKQHLILFSLSLGFLLSCNNENQTGRSNEQDEASPNGETMMDENGRMNGNGMMGQEGMGEGMMQDQDTSGDDTGGMMGNGMMDQNGMGMMQDGMMSEEMREAMMSRGMGPEMMKDMRSIRQMLMNHEQIERRVEDLPNGVKTWTTSEDPEIAEAIQTHVRQMKERMEEDKPIRQMDPLFRELFEHADKIDMQIEDLENGVLVVETSADPQVVKLIRQHAHRAVSEFAKQGMQRAMQATPLPEGYQE